jgi:hypothetical protein
MMSNDVAMLAAVQYGDCEERPAPVAAIDARGIAP